MKLCVHCQHFKRGADNCLHPENTYVSLVDGEVHIKQFPGVLRSEHGKCGENGVWFVDLSMQEAA